MWRSWVLVGVVFPGLQKVPAIHLNSKAWSPNSPEGVPHKALEKGSVARPGVKAESNKGTAIPNSVHLADHLRGDVKEVASKDGDPPVRGTVPPPLEEELKGNKKDHLNARYVAPDHRQSVFVEELLDDTLDTLNP